MRKPVIKLHRLRSFLFGAHTERDLDRELRHHIESLITDNIATGMSAENARIEALARFGDVESIKAECRAIHSDSLPGAVRLLVGFIVSGGVGLWLSSLPSQAHVLGQMLIITIALCWLLLFLRARLSLNNNSSSPPHGWSISHESYVFEPRSLTARLINLSRISAPRVFAAFALMAFGLGAVALVSSAKALSNHWALLQEKDNDLTRFAGTWVLTVGSVYDLKDTPAPFRNLPPGLSRDLPVAQVIIEVNGEKAKGRRLLYNYTAGASPGSPNVEKGEVELINIQAHSNLLSGNASDENGKLPGGWEMKFIGGDQVEVRLTGDNVPEEMKKFVLTLTREKKK